MNAEKTILLVEDDVLIAESERIIFEKYGYRVLSAKNGEHAVQTVESGKKIDLILMDIDLGSGIDGTEAAEIILKKYDLPVLFLSSHDEPETVKKTEKITSYGYIMKNSAETVLIASIKMAFKLYDAHMHIDKQYSDLQAAHEELQSTIEELESANEEMEAANELLTESEQELSEKRKELYDSHMRLLTVFNNINGFIYVADMQTYEILFVNDFAVKTWGSIEGAKCWKSIQVGQNGPCTFCTNHLLIDSNGKPTGIYRWEVQNTVNQRWYECSDSAIEWIDGRIVRLEIALDITDRKHAEEMINTLLQEKDFLLKESHHRIKNNMGLVKSLLSLQANLHNGTECASVLNDAAIRIQNMAILYNNLYCNETSGNLNINSFLSSLVSQITGLSGSTNPLKSEVKAVDFMLNTRLLSPLGIILNELITNSIKYAFSDTGEPLISVTAEESDGIVTVTCSTA